MRRVRAPSIPLFLLLAAACSPAPPSRSAPGTYAPLATTNVDALPPGSTAPPAPRADGRLPSLATPLRYALALTVDPSKDHFSGIATIMVSIPSPTPYVVLNGRDLRIASAVAKVGGRDIAATATPRAGTGSAAAEEIVLAFPERLPAGRATLEIRYEAPWGDDLAGLYRVKDGGSWYAFSQFESVDARRAFPCFDEPAFKTAFDVTLTVPKGMSAFANAPEASRTDSETWTTVAFKTTRPLPTYLVAFAVGDLETKDGAQTPVPIRVVAPRGKAALGGLALDAAQALLTRYGDYFGIRYPYEKLDLVAVPDFAAGAMENAGLITFREERLLLEPTHASTDGRRAMESVMAHELAHQWFGDLVTLAWWNDAWLNEGFATWATEKIVDEWQPAFGARLDALARLPEAMDLDAMRSARRVREPVTSPSAAIESFDAITYDKGAAVLWMIEHWIGEDTFQRGVRDYLHAKAWQTATAEDLLRALDVASNKDVSKVAATFLDQTGVPEVEASFVCPSVGPATASLAQSTWEPLGESAPAGTPHAWVIPLCAKVDGHRDPVCATVTAGPPAYAALGKCAGFFYPNAGEEGYYRYSMAAKDFLALARAQASLTTPEQMGLVSNAWAAVRSGSLGPDALFDALPALDAATEGHVVGEIVDILDEARDALVEDDARAPFRAYVAARFRARKFTLGWQPIPGETDERRIARVNTLVAMGRLAEDDATLREADQLAAKWLANPASVPGEVAGVAVALASLRAGAPREAGLEQAVVHAKTPAERSIAVRGLGALRDGEALRHALDFAIGPDVRISELRRVLYDALRDAGGRALVLDWMKARWDALRQKMRGRSIGWLARVPALTCAAAERDAIAGFLGERLAGVEGVRRGLDQANERAGLCIALRAEGAAKATAYFRH
jgi:aminopeptidase N